LPERSLTAVDTVAVYVLEAASELIGVSVATRVVALYVRVTGTRAFVGSRSATVLVVIVLESIDSLNVTEAELAWLIPVAPLTGELEVTVGATASAA